MLLVSYCYFAYRSYGKPPRSAASDQNLRKKVCDTDCTTWGILCRSPIRNANIVPLAPLPPTKSCRIQHRTCGLRLRHAPERNTKQLLFEALGRRSTARFCVSGPRRNAQALAFTLIERLEAVHAFCRSGRGRNPAYRVRVIAQIALNRQTRIHPWYLQPVMTLW